MRNIRSSFIVFILVAAFLSASVGNAFAREKGPNPGDVINSRFEYKVLSFNRLNTDEAFENGLNALGDDHWELVAVERVTYNGMDTQLKFIFKRPKN